MAYKAFVSSTFEDLKKHRQWVIAALRKAGIQVDPMEEWTASSVTPKDFSRARVEGCDLCVLLVGFRRGHIPRGETSSVTQLEHEAALREGIDVLAFLLAEGSEWPDEFDERASDPGIRRWRSDLMEGKGVGFFGPEPSSVEIAPALTRWVSEKQQSLGSADRRRERLTLLRWVERIPQQFDDYFTTLWRAGFGKPRPPADEVEGLDREMREVLGLYTRIVELLPTAFEETRPSKRERGCFDEVFPAFQREATACFSASRTLITGFAAPCSDGSRREIGFSTLYSALEVQEHLRILRMAAEEIVNQFPVDEVEDSRRDRAS